MNIKEVERTVIAKPVASRPTISDFRPFSELIAGATNGSPSSEPIVTAIRPKTVRFKPVMSPPPVEMVSSWEVLTGTQSCHLSDKILKSTHASPLYKPLAKTVSKAAISLLANMETFNASHEQALTQNLASQSEMVKSTDLPKLTPVESVNDKRPQLCTNNCDGYDGYNWRKYGQKQVKGSEYPRSYYRCTHADCIVKKKVERSRNGKIAEIVYKGEHTHSKPRVARRHAFDGTTEDLIHQFPNNLHNYDDEGVGSSSRLTDFVKVKGSDYYASSAAFDNDGLCGVPLVHDAPTSKRRRSLNQLNETHGEGLPEQPQVVVHNATDSEATSDGYRWRKYGQKVVKGNPYPRSYYRCTGVNCDVRKHVERATDDPTVFITTYEGKHNHEMPLKKTN